MLHSPGDPNFSAWGTGVDEVLAGKLDTTVASSTYVSKVAPPTGVSATDTANITAAIAALPATGGELRFPCRDLRHHGRVHHRGPGHCDRCRNGWPGQRSGQWVS